MNNKSSFIKLIQVWGIIILVAMAGSIVAIDIVNSYLDLNSRTEQMRTDYVAQQKQLIKREVDRVVAMIQHKKAQSEELTKKKIKSRVYEAYAVAQNIYQHNKNSKNKAEIQQMILNALRPIRFEQGRGYYFIETLSADIVMSPAFPAFEGKNFINLQDSKGKYVVREEMKLLQDQGEGYAVGFWPKPNTDQQQDYKKITFVKKLDLYDWSVGTGLYVDNVAAQIKEDLLTTISSIRFGTDGYIFVVTYDGTTLMNDTQRQLIGKNIWELVDPNGVKVIQEQRKAVENPAGDFIYYVWNKPSSKHVVTKTSFIRGVEDWEWMIGAGVYLDDVENEIAAMHTELNQQIKTTIIYFIMIVVGVVVFFLLLFRSLRQRLTNDFNLFISLSNKAASSSEEIDQDLIQFDELDQMAENTNTLLQSLRQSEQYFRTLMEQSPLSIQIFDVNGLTISANKAWEELWQSSISHVVGKYNALEDKSLLGTEWRNQFIKVFSGETVDLPELEYDPADIGEDGRKRIIKCLAFPIRNKGKIERVVLIHQDVTAQKQVEEDLQKIEKLESVGTLAGGIAHDFNNILMGVFGNISMAKVKLPEDHPSIKYLDGAETTMGRATSLTKQLLTFAKGGAPIRENVSIAQLVEEVVDFDLSGSNVKLVFDQAEDLWWADVDRGQSQQVISNLTINANQAMPDGGHLYVSLENVQFETDSLPDLPAGRYVKITVRDEGTGIEQEYLDRIFDPYFSTKQAGSGLGLATVYSIINKHGGSLSVESRVGEGAIFTIYLPAAKTSQLLGNEPAKTKFVIENQSGRILVMDDEKEIRLVSSQLLKIIGFLAETAADGENAIAMYKQAMQAGEPFDAVIMDLTIAGGMGGEETIGKLLAIDPQVKAIVSSGYSEDPVMANYAEYGFKGIITKPYSLDDLQKVLTGVLGS